MNAYHQYSKPDNHYQLAAIQSPVSRRSLFARAACLALAPLAARLAAKLPVAEAAGWTRVPQRATVLYASTDAGVYASFDSFCFSSDGGVPYYYKCVMSESGDLTTQPYEPWLSVSDSQRVDLLDGGAS